MKKLSLMVLLTGSFLVACGFGQAAPDTSAFSESMIAKEKALIETRRKGDAEALKKMLAENFTMVGIDGGWIDGADAADEMDASDYLDFIVYNFRVVPVSDDVAIVSYEAAMQKAPEEDQGPPPRYQHFSSTWVRQNREWRLKFEQTTAKHWGDW